MRQAIYSTPLFFCECHGHTAGYRVFEIACKLLPAVAHETSGLQEPVECVDVLCMQLVTGYLQLAFDCFLVSHM